MSSKYLLIDTLSLYTRPQPLFPRVKQQPVPVPWSSRQALFDRLNFQKNFPDFPKKFALLETKKKLWRQRQLN